MTGIEAFVRSPAQHLLRTALIKQSNRHATAAPAKRTMTAHQGIETSPLPSATPSCCSTGSPLADGN